MAENILQPPTLKEMGWSLKRSSFSLRELILSSQVIKIGVHTSGIVVKFKWDVCESILQTAKHYVVIMAGDSFHSHVSYPLGRYGHCFESGRRAKCLSLKIFLLGLHLTSPTVIQHSSNIKRASVRGAQHIRHAQESIKTFSCLFSFFKDLIWKAEF